MSTSHSPKWRILFEISTTLVMIGLGTAVVWQGWARATPSAPGRDVPVPRTPVSITGNPFLGSSGARIAIVEYSDFECGFCGKAARETLPNVIREYVDTGRVRLVFKHLPLEMHKLATGAAIASECAAQQGKFWQMHDRLFSPPLRLADLELRMSAEAVGLDLSRYDTCRSASDSAKRVDLDKAEAQGLGITGTPTFLLGRVESDGRVRVSDLLTGTKPVSVFKEVLDRLLKKA